MTAPVNKTPLSIDYTSRDYYALRADLIARMKTRLTDWQGNDPADPGLALIEAIAYMGDLTNYYIDRAANEAFIGTATQRQSVINIAKTYGYYPTGYRAASTVIRLTNASSEDYTVPAGTQFIASVIKDEIVQQVIFTLTNNCTVLANSTSDVTATQTEDISNRPENYSPELNGEILGISYGLPDQQFTLSSNHVVDGSVQIWVKNGNTYEKWTEVRHITDAGPKDAAYYLTLDSNNYVCVNFGDGVSGIIPPIHAPIKAVYQVGGGSVGNLPSATILDLHQTFGIDDVLATNLRRYITAELTIDAVGGEDPEETNSIRQNAPLLLTAMNRAVTLQDFARLSLGVNSVGKANAYATVPTSVTVYVAPQQNEGNADSYPGYSGSVFSLSSEVTPSFTAMATDVSNYLSDKTLIGTSVTVSPPLYSPVLLSLAYTKKTGYSADTVEANIRTAVFNYYSYQKMYFAQVITPEDVEATLRRAEGVATLQVVLMSRADQDVPTRSVLVGSPSELFTFEDSNVLVNLLSSDSSLTDLVLNDGVTNIALSPSFVSGFYYYNGSTSQSTVTVTATGTTGATLYASDGTASNQITSAIASAPFSLVSGVNTFTITVVAADKISTNTYVVKITK